MALRLEILKVSMYSSTTLSTKKEGTFALTTDNTPAYVYLEYEKDHVQLYTVSMLCINYQQKMYQPTSITVDIEFMPYKDTNGSQKWNSIKKANIVSLFQDKQVKLFDMEGVESKEKIDTDKDVPVKNIVGLDFYVQDVIPNYYNGYMIVTLKIYSLDQLMTRKQTSNVFVAKKLSNILASQVASFKQPYNNNATIKCDSANLKNLPCKKSTSSTQNDTEHIFPYLVQYNESIYDMLARTANRWGEFMFYENGKLNIGYDEKTVTGITKFYRIKYLNLDKTSDIGAFFDCAAKYDKNINDTPYKKSPNSLKGLLFAPGGKGDKVAMNAFTSFLKTDKNVPTFLTNWLLDETLSWGKAEINNLSKNQKFNKEHFSNENNKPEQYGDYDFKKKKETDNNTQNVSSKKDHAYNPFTEINSGFTESLYDSILTLEAKAGNDAICIEFDTTFPGLKLGQIIKYDNIEYIVVQIDCTPNNRLKVGDDMWVNINNDKPVPAYQIIALAKQDKSFYPTIIPNGHVRYSEPQLATVKSASDPLGLGRVRVTFDWQGENTTDEDYSPWLQYAANASGQTGIIGKHYKGDKVFVGFVNGNVERPYVIGGISDGASADVECTTPGGHTLKIRDEKDGIIKFLTGMFWPGWKTISGFCPPMSGIDTSNVENSNALGGGFELSDNYGIYKISGSTHDREVNISSAWGNVKINAFTGITLSAPNGNVTIEGKNVSIKAGNNIELISGSNVEHKIMGGDASGFFTDILAAVTKKLTEMALSVVTIDLSLVRAAFEIVFRPTEGKLLVKSNRYLMFESGKGKCLYPEGAYVDHTTYEKEMAKNATKDLREGLKLTSSVKEMVDCLSAVANLVDQRYRDAYNNCVYLREEFENTINDGWRLSATYDPSKTPDYCKGFSELKTEFWADGPYQPFTDDDLDYKDGFALDSSNVYGFTDDMITRYCHDNTINQVATPRNEIEDAICASRMERMQLILDAANALRKGICDLQVISLLDKKDLEKQFKSFKTKLTDNMRNALMAAFKTTKLGNDTFYLKKIEGDAKNLATTYRENDLQAHRKVLKRKAAILMLEAMGFKDEWRKKKPNPNYAAPAPLMLGQAQAAPAMPSHILELERKFNADELTDTYWANYVSSIESVPDLTPDKWKITKQAEKQAKAFADNYTKVFSAYSENESWSGNKNGGILFSTNANIYSLTNNIMEVPSPFRENLQTADDTTGDTTITTFLTELRNKLSGLD